ncbi:MAG: hypothetical protein C3F02_01945 [Parcubacteria group bacterium]|nr:MAG: hypothetical protein C3F02_01945 [Parcubacteria group bacterium]
MRRNNKVTWVNFLHLYQPPWQEPGILEKVAIESYDYLLTLLEKYPKYRASINISGSLLEQLATVKPGILARLQRLVRVRRIELVGTAYYHPILPLVSPQDAIRQIKLNQQALEKFFPDSMVSGFYLPEMAYSLPVAKLVKKLGYQWLILDPIHYVGQIDKNIQYLLKNTGLKIIFRDRAISKSYPPRIIFDFLEKNKKQTFISATDAEIYGHWHEDKQGFIEKLMFVERLEILTVSQYLNKLKKTEVINLRPASWESTLSEIKGKNFYSLWANPKNKIHRLLWDLLHLASRLVAKYSQDANIFWARQHLERGLSSCTFWWASARRPSPFSSLTWNPDMIDKGAKELVLSVRSLARAKSPEKVRAEELYLAIQKETWFKHWYKFNKFFD